MVPKPEGIAVNFRIANAEVIRKVERLAKETGLAKIAAIELAVDRLLSEIDDTTKLDARITSILKQLDQIPDRLVAHDPLTWNEHGLTTAKV